MEGAEVDVDDDSDRYQLLNEIGRGSFAPVYRAWDEKDGKYVAIKLFNLEDGIRIKHYYTISRYLTFHF